MDQEGNVYDMLHENFIGKANMNISPHNQMNEEKARDEKPKVAHVMIDSQES